MLAASSPWSTSSRMIWRILKDWKYTQGINNKCYSHQDYPGFQLAIFVSVVPYSAIWTFRVNNSSSRKVAIISHIFKPIFAVLRNQWTAQRRVMHRIWGQQPPRWAFQRLWTSVIGFLDLLQPQSWWPATKQSRTQRLRSLPATCHSKDLKGIACNMYIIIYMLM